jgi:hypothetical protein
MLHSLKADIVMTEGFQPGAGGDPQEPPPAQPGPQPGHGQEQPSFGAWPEGLGFPAAPPRRRRMGLIIGIAAALVGLTSAIGVGVGVGLRGSSGSNGLSGSSGRSISLPSVLLGLPKYAGSSGQIINAGLARQEAAGSKGVLVHVVAAAYGDQSGARPGFAVAGGGFCGSCRPNPASTVVQFMVSHGFADARSFAPGPEGGTLACGTHTGGAVIDCKWGNATGGGDILYFHGFVSGLADAAAKARQIIAAVEH